MKCLGRTNRMCLSSAVFVAVALRGSAGMGAEWINTPASPGNLPSFSDPAQWTPPGVPGPADTAEFPNGGVVGFSADANTAGVTITSSTQCTNFYLGLSPNSMPPSGTPHTYTVNGNGSSAFSASNAFNVFVYGGMLSIPNGGMLLTNSSMNVGSYGNLMVAGTTEINGSVMTVSNPNAGFDTSTASFSTGALLVANQGSGMLAVGQQANVSVAHDLSIAPQSGTIGHVTVQNSNVAVQGNVYVGGSAAGPGGTGDLNVGYGNVLFGQLQTNHLVVYAGSTVTTNQCGNIYTNVSDVSGQLLVQSTTGSGGGLHAQSAINLLPGSATTLAASTTLDSPTVTLSSGAIFSGSGFVTGHLINGGEIDASRLKVLPFGSANSGSYTQLSSGVLSGLVGAGSDSLMTVTGTVAVDGTLRLLFDTTVHSGDSFPVISASSITGSFEAIDLEGLTGFTATFSDITGRVTLSGGNPDHGGGNGPAPEPSGLALLGLATAGLWLRIKSR